MKTKNSKEQNFVNEREGYITSKEAAAYLGLSMQYLYKLTHKKVLSFYRPTGKLIYFKISELNKFMEKSKVLSAEEIISINLLKVKK